MELSNGKLHSPIFANVNFANMFFVPFPYTTEALGINETDC